MSNIAYLQTNFIGLAIVIIIYLHSRYTDRGQPQQYIFQAILICNGIVLIADTITWLFDGLTFVGARVWLEIAALLFYLIGILLMSLWVVYCDYRLSPDKRAHRRHFLYFIPWFACVILLALNFKTGWLYYFDAQNVYHRGPLQLIQVVLNGAYLLGSMALIISRARSKHLAHRRDAYLLLLFSIPPCIAMVLQAIFYGLALIPNSVALSMLIIFLQRLSSLITIDHLTGLSNQREFDKYVEDRIAAYRVGQILFLCVMDANDFKVINDTLGHHVGNQALQRFASSLRRVRQRGDCLARIGGDEFALVGYRDSTEDVDAIAHAVQAQLHAENTKGLPYTLSLSFGGVVYDPVLHQDPDAFLQAADALMYKNKARNRHDR